MHLYPYMWSHHILDPFRCRACGPHGGRRYIYIFISYCASSIYSWQFLFLRIPKLLLVCWMPSILPSNRGSHSCPPETCMQRDGERQAEADFSLKELKKEKPQCAANIPATIFQVHDLLSHLSWTLECVQLSLQGQAAVQAAVPCFSLWNQCSIA